jgi:hypothetical protein
MGATQSTQKKQWMQQIVDRLDMYDEEVFMVIASVEQLNEIYMDDLDPQKRGTAVTTSLDEHDRFVVFGDGCRIVQRCVSPIDSLEYIVIAAKCNTCIKVGEDYAFKGKITTYHRDCCGKGRTFFI